MTRNSTTTRKGNNGNSNGKGKAVKAKAAAAPVKGKQGKQGKQGKAVKAAPAKREYKPKPGTGLEFGLSDRIVLKVDSNPKRQGSASAERFEGYFKAAKAAKARRAQLTVADVVAAGVTLADVRWDWGQGYIDVK